jgi:hypothetical protein
MTRTNVRTLVSIAAACWLVVGGYGLAEVVAEDAGDNWEIGYSIFAIALMLGAILTVAALWVVSNPSARPVLRSVGLVVCGLGVVTTFVAWALPLWMTVLAIGFALVAASGIPPWRRPVAALAAAQLLGMAALFIGITAEVGRVDEYGDYPAAFGIGLLVTAVATIASLYLLDRSLLAPATAPDRVGAQ